MKTPFTLKRLVVEHKGNVLFNVKFTDETLQRETVFSTVIIGANGTGKSYLLTIITEFFRAISSRKASKENNLRYEQYLIEYSLGNDNYRIGVKGKGKSWRAEVNGITTDIKNIELPSKFLATSYMVNDKFVFKASDVVETADEYEYLGIRQTSNAAWTNSLSRRISDAFIEHSMKKSFSKVTEVLRFLGFEPKVALIYEPTLVSVFKSKTPASRLQARIKRYRKSEDYRSLTAKKLKEKDIEELLTFINITCKTRDVIKVDNKHAVQYFLDLNLTESVPINHIQEDYLLLRSLVDLKLINQPRLILFKEGEAFDFEYASSGEKHLLFTLLNISTKIKHNSLVLIDEPEISLHPNWQMKYVDCIKKVFRDFCSSHFIIATHSHYIVSDLEPTTSSLVVMSIHNENGKNVRMAELVGYSTYAWSAENILYNVFGVRTTRNFYFEMDIGNLITMVKDKSKEFEKIETLYNKLEKYVLGANDPLNLVLQEVKQYISTGKLSVLKSSVDGDSQ